MTEDDLRADYVALATKRLLELRRNGKLSEISVRVLDQVLAERGVAVEQAITKDASMKGHFGMIITTTISSVALSLICGFVFIWYVMPVGLGQDLESNCNVNGLGQGTCSFTNIGWTPGTSCVSVQLINAENESISSGTVCSGRVWPNDTVERRISIIVGDHCDDNTGSGKAWNEVCHIDVTHR